jgi:hypothetical protein
VSDQYPPDEFDEIAKRGGPVGVHRAPRPWWSRLVAPVIVFLIAGAVAYLIAWYLWSRTVETPDEPTPTTTESVEATVTPSPSATSSPSATTSASPTAAPTQEVNFDAKVTVLNGSGIAGLAADNQKILKDAGFTSVGADNLTGTKPSANVVVYVTDDLKATAQEVAKQLGISKVALGTPQAAVDVEVRLVTDPSK